MNNGFVAAGVPQWVVVHLDKSVDVVHIALGVLDPVNVVQLPLLEVTRFVVGDEVAKRSGLLVVFSVLRRLIQPEHHLLQGFSVQTSHAVSLLFDFTSRVLDQSGIQAVLHRRSGAFFNNARQVGLGFLCAHVRCVKVHSRSLHQTLGCILFHFLRFHCWIEDDGHQLIRYLSANRFDQLSKIRLRKLGHDLGVGIVVVNAVGKPNALEVGLEAVPAIGRLVTLEACVDGFEQVTDAQVVPVVLVVHHVPTAQSRLVQAVHQRPLLRGKLVPSGHLVPNHLEVRKLFGLPNESAGIRLTRSLFGCGVGCPVV